MSYLAPALENPNVLTSRQLRSVKEFFSQSIKLLTLFEVARGYKGTRFQLDLYRFLVSELHIWRYGLTVLQKRTFSGVFSDAHQVSSALTQKFDGLFGDVVNCRNVLQHFEKYVFEADQGVRLKQSEFDRIDAPVECGGRISQFQACLVGDRFCASHINGRINFVYVGSDFPQLVGEILSAYCDAINGNSAVSIALMTFEEIKELDAHMENLLTTQVDPKEGIGIISCVFSRKSEIEANKEK